MHLKYRPDIDGLRGIAVLAVVLYHAFPDQFPGGFIGVDIFFVLSGFLISSIIFKNLTNQTFSFIDFYSRRIRRIFPALLVTFVFCYALGWFVLLPHEYQQLGKHIAGGAGFISNFVLWNESGYFDNTAITKPLLHLWSLGIEEQFYFVWPLILWAAYKKNINWLLVTITIAISSFVWNIALVNADPIVTFYSPGTRVWELLIGAGLAYASNDRPIGIKKIGFLIVLAAVLALSALICCVFFLHKKLAFPGYWALIPTISAAFLIYSGSNSKITQQVLSSRVLVWFGLISFPLYLWHWPLISFARIIEGEQLSTKALTLIVVLSIALAWLTYIVIEKPIRYGGKLIAKTSSLLILLAVIGYVGLNTYLRNGLDFRGPQIVGKDRGYEGGPGGTLERRCGLPESISTGFTCWQDTRPALKFALVGDSKAGAIHGGLVRTSTPDGRWMFIGAGSKGAPLPLITSNPLYAQYQYSSITAINAIAADQQIEIVLIASATRALFQLKNDTDIEDLAATKNYEVVLDGLQRVIDILKAGNKKIVLLVDNPTLPHPEDCLPRTTSSDLLNRMLKQTMNQRCHLSVDRHLELSRKYRQLLTTLAEKNEKSVFLFDTIPFMCSQADKICSTVKDGRLMYDGTDHISDYAAGVIGKELNLYMQKILKNEM
jgi:peptidoglycan/LPS O-acetylase OafA/YrhL